MIAFACAHCGRKATRPAGHVNRSRARGDNLYCGLECSALGRRKGQSKAEKVEAKRLYDVEYRAKNRELLRQKKHEYFVRTYDPEAARVERKRRMPKHVEYCRRPEYKKWKSEYDKKYRANKYYGPFADAFLMLQQIENEVRKRATHYEIRQENETYGKIQKRRREDGADNRDRRHQTSDSE